MSDKSRLLSANDLHVLMTQFLSAATSIHTAMCRFDDEHAAQANLNSALQSALVGAGQCCRIHASDKRLIAPPLNEAAP